MMIRAMFVDLKLETNILGSSNFCLTGSSSYHKLQILVKKQETHEASN